MLRHFVSPVRLLGRRTQVKTVTRTIAVSALRFDSDGGRPPIHVEASGDSPSIPPFVEKFEEPLDEKRARLVYQSRKRGILENGLLLGGFADKHLDQFNEEQLVLYDRLINLPSNDWEIYYWATETKPTPPEFDNDVMKMLKAHTKNKHKEERFTLPQLPELNK